MKKIPINEAAKDIVFIGSVLLVLTHSKTVLGY